MTIGQRVAQAVKKRAREQNISLDLERAFIGVESKSFRDWKNGKCDPSAYYLQQLAMRGYDIMWILLGDEHGQRNGN
jgi:hypothetical protein